jgi:protein phosphatase
LTGHEVEPTLIMREARAGDRYLLCSDGLSDPVSHETILEALQIANVAESADRLIELALRGGGPDNVTVVVADVIDNSDYDYGQTQPILAGAVSGDDDQPPPNTAAGRASAFNPRRNEAKRVLPEPEEPPRPLKSRRRMFIAAAVVVLVVLAGMAVGREIIRSNYYVAAHEDTVSIMRGVPGSILGYPLQEPYRQGCLTERNGLTLISPGQQPRDCQIFRVSDLKPSEQRQVLAGLPTGSEDQAINQINQLARDSLLPICAPPPPPAPRTSAAPHRPAPSNSPGVPNIPPTRGDTQTPAPETPRTVTQPPASPAPRPPTPESPTPESPAPESPAPKPPPPPTVTALPPPPPEPGTNCREVS